MAVQLDHTIIPAHDKHASAAFLAEMLGLTVGEPEGPFIPVSMSNGVTLDFMTRDVSPQHYAFRLDQDEFDAAYGRLRTAGVPTFADPFFEEPDEMYVEDGERGVYFHDPAGHTMEILTDATE